LTETTQPPKGKGRPTPKRSEAEKGRRQPLVAPKGKAANRGAKNARSQGRVSAREAMRTGDERNYPPIAAGPERALVRDTVDARRSLGRYAIAGWGLGILLSLVPTAATQAIGSLMFPLVVVVLVLDASGAGRAVRRALDERWPNGTEASRRSLVWYGIARNTQFRRQRLPRPRFAAGGAPITPP
jgi:hypothetical protein